MALKYGSTTIPATGTVKFGSTACNTVKFGSTVVWQKEAYLFNGGTITSLGGTTISRAAKQAGITVAHDFKVHDRSWVNYATFNIYTNGSQWQYGHCLFGKPQKIDLTGYNTISLDAAFSDGTANQRQIMIIVSDSFPGEGDNTFNAINSNNLANGWTSPWSGNAGATVTCNISGVTGSHYVLFGAACEYSTWLNVYLTNLRLY